VCVSSVHINNCLTRIGTACVLNAILTIMILNDSILDFVLLFYRKQNRNTVTQTPCYKDTVLTNSDETESMLNYFSSTFAFLFVRLHPISWGRVGACAVTVGQANRRSRSGMTSSPIELNTAQVTPQRVSDLTAPMKIKSF